ncbi:MFS general substrate transporter [Lenzites betulinus]|nr:MFS general substrate transporter [Lenzites betulinus]
MKADVEIKTEVADEYSLGSPSTERAASEHLSADLAVEKREPDDFEATEFPDGGRGWVVVLGCFIFSTATVGWALVSRAWGVTEEYFRAHMFPGTPDATLTALGSFSSVIMTVGGIVAGKLADRYGYKPFLAAGALIWIASMLASAFCTTIWQFFITMGLMQGIADALIFPIIVALPAQWFKRYCAFATGIVVAGSSIGGAVGTLVYRQLITTIGLRKALAVFTAIDAVALGAAYAMIQERRPVGGRAAIVWVDRAYFRDPVFWSVAGCFFFVVFGYLGPVFLLPTFTVQKVQGLSEILTALPLVVLNLSAALGRTLVGFVADKFGPVNSLMVAIALSGLTQLVVWTSISTYGGIMVFAILYGFFCGCFLSLVAAVVARIYSDGTAQLAGLSGLLLLFNTPGYAAGAPLAGAILNATDNDWRAVAGYCGAVQVVAALSLVYARLKREPRVFAVY